MRQPDRRFYIALSALGLLLYVWAFGGQWQLAALPPGFPPVTSEYPLQFNGIEAARPDDVQFLAEAFDPGDPVTVITATGERHETVLRRAYSAPYLLLAFASGSYFWLVAAFFFAKRAEMSQIRDFFWISYLYGLSIMLGGVFGRVELADSTVWRGLLQMLSLAVLPVMFLRLSLNFPRRSPLLDEHRWAILVLGMLAGGVFAWQAVSMLRFVADPGPSRAAALWLPGAVADTVMAVEVAAGFLILYGRSRRLALTRERDQAKWILFGFALGATPYVFVRSLPQVLGFDAPLGPTFDRVCEMAIPTAFMLAVVRYRFLDIDIIIRRSLIYFGIAAAVVGLYLLIGVFIGQWIEGSPLSWSWSVPIAIGLVAGVGFNPLRRFIGSIVDRAFFKIRHDYGKALAALDRSLSHASSQRAWCDIVDGMLQDQLRPILHAVAVRVPKETIVVGSLERSAVETLFSALDDRPGTRMLAAPQCTSLPELEDERFPKALIEAGVVLANQVFVEGRAVGIVLLGPKQSQRLYVETDIALVRDGIARASHALERIRLTQAVAEEAIARRQLDELNLLKSDFLSRVAHDLRTPLASISWSTENLLDGLAGELSAKQSDYLRSVKISSVHLARLVNNLLEISRLEQRPEGLELGDVGLRPVLESSLRVIEPLAREKNVSLRLRGQNNVAVRANADKLSEIATNLLDNAVKYTAPDTVIELSIGVDPSGLGEFSVRDHGPGLDEETIATLFEQFRQAAPSPHSRRHGFGLGLYIVKSYADLMDGAVLAANHPDGGAVFRCSLPLVSSNPEESA